MSEYASIHAKNLLEMLLDVYALTNMHRSSENSEYRQMAAAHLSRIELEIKALKRALTQEDSTSE